MRDNTTGQHDTKDYYVGKGILTFADLDSAGWPLGYRDLGNAPDFSFSVESENYEHNSSRSGLANVDLDIPIKTNVTCSFTLENFNVKNMEMFLSGATSDMAVGTKAGEASMTQCHGAGVGEVQGGLWFDLRKVVGTVETRYLGIQDKADLTLQLNDGTSQVSLTEGVDYLVNEKFGRVFLIATAANILGIDAANDYLEFQLAANVAAPDTAKELKALSTSSRKGALRFTAENANAEDSDPQQFSEVNFYNVTLSPNGEVNMVSDEAAQMQFTGSATKSTAVGKTMSIIYNE